MRGGGVIWSSTEFKRSYSEPGLQVLNEFESTTKSDRVKVFSNVQ